jgi:hypothetical protein
LTESEDWKEMPEEQEEEEEEAIGRGRGFFGCGEE